MNNDNKRDDDVIDINYNKYKSSIKRIISIVVVVILLLAFALNSFYLLDSKEAAVVLRLGKVNNVENQAGLHFKVPFIDQARIVNIENVYEMSYGFRTSVSASEKNSPQYIDATDEAQVIVDAANNNASIALLSLNILYKVKDPEDYLFKVDDVEGTLRLALEDTVRNTLQAFTLDEARTNKEYINVEILPVLQRKLDSYQAGILITSVQTQNVELLPAVDKAYQQKENANQYMNGKLEEAEKYNNTIIPQAEAEAEKLIEEASGYRAEVIANAKAAIAQYEALYTEYQNNPDIVKEKYYIETMREFITDNNIIVDLTNESDIYKFFNMDGEMTNSNIIKEQISSNNN